MNNNTMKIKIQLQKDNHFNNLLRNKIGIKLLTKLLNAVITSDIITKNSENLIMRLIYAHSLDFQILNINDAYPAYIGTYDIYDKNLTIFNINKSDKIIHY